MKHYDVYAIIDGEETMVICNGIDMFIDVCETLGEAVMRVFEWQNSRLDGKQIVIDWM